MGLLDGIIKGKGGDIAESIGNVVDKITTTDEEKLKAKTALTEIVIGKVAEVVMATKEVLLAELGGNSLQRNWRPIVMLCFAGIVVYEYFLAPVFHLQRANLPDRFFDLLELGLGGYVIGRSVEKVADTVTKNVDVSFLKKKDRKDAEK